MLLQGRPSLSTPQIEIKEAFVSELLAVFLGFGVIMVNSANTAKIRSCGSCSGPAIERKNFLTQYDTTYGLAIFCHLNGIPPSAVTPVL